VTTLADVVEYHLALVDVLPDPEELRGGSTRPSLPRQYRSMLDRGEDSIAEALAILSDPSAYPAMFHCSAGKDRTGILAAVVLGVLGVPDEVIVADYVLSGRAMHRLVDHYKRAYPDAEEQLTRIAPAMVAADPAAMTAFIAASGPTTGASTTTPTRSVSGAASDTSAPRSSAERAR